MTRLTRKDFVSDAYATRQARFAALGPALITHPKRYVVQALRSTLVRDVGIPADVFGRRAFESAIKRAVERVDTVRRVAGKTWNSVALGHYRAVFA